MKEETKSRLDEFLTNMLEAIENGGEFVLEQSPLVAREIVAWHFWSNGCWAVFWLTAIVVMLLSWWKTEKMVKKWPSDTKDDRDGKMFMRIIPAILGIPALLLFTLGFIEMAVEAMQAVVAPRLVVIEHISDLLN